MPTLIPKTQESILGKMMHKGDDLEFTPALATAKDVLDFAGS